MTGAKHSETCLRFEPARLCATRQENLGGTPMLFGQLTRRRGRCRVSLSGVPKCHRRRIPFHVAVAAQGLLRGGGGRDERREDDDIGEVVTGLGVKVPPHVNQLEGAVTRGPRRPLAPETGSSSTSRQR